MSCVFELDGAAHCPMRKKKNGADCSAPFEHDFKLT